jgi:hypothetical protein
MNSIIDPQSADRLAKLCGLFGSDHDGERANAAAMADRLIRDLGLTWREVLITSPPKAAVSVSSSWREPKTADECVGLALRHTDLLSDWEYDFLLNIRGRRNLSDKQWNVVDRIVSRIRAYCA